jgi:hypothetical protein
MKKPIAVALLSLVSLGRPVVARQSGQPPAAGAPRQNPPYVREGSIGNTPKQGIPLTGAPFEFRPVEKWIGEKFIFLPKPRSSQEYGHLNFSGGKTRVTGTGWPTYAECAGRIGTVTDVATDGEDANVYHVKLRMDDDGRVYEASTMNGTVDGIGLVADIEAARSLWLGKTLWYRGGSLGTYDADTDQVGDVKVKRYCAVKVLDIVAGWYDMTPVRFILQTGEGTTGFVDVNPSGTNVGDTLVGEKKKFEERFLTYDPRKEYTWSPSVWSAIEAEKVFVGMTAEQVQFSWGAPERINATLVQGGRQEQWVYSETYVYLENGLVTAIQSQR